MYSGARDARIFNAAPRHGRLQRRKIYFFLVPWILMEIRIERMAKIFQNKLRGI
jgi:hypothetical protein